MLILYGHRLLSRKWLKGMGVILGAVIIVCESIALFSRAIA